MAEAPVLPSWRYSLTGQSRIITTADELAALEAGQWFESPQEAADAATARTTEPDGGEESPRRSRR